MVELIYFSIVFVTVCGETTEIHCVDVDSPMQQVLAHAIGDKLILNHK
jgi:hypothetical protein